MSVGTLHPPAESGVRPSTPTDGPARADGSTWLRTGWSRALFTLGASVVVGLAAGFGAETAVAALLGVTVVVVVLLRPAIGAYTLVAVVPPVSGLRAGLPVPQLRLSEALIACIGVLLLVLARPGRTPRWRAFDWCALGYVLATAGLGAADLLSGGSPLTVADANKLLGPAQFFILYRAVLTTLTTERQREAALRLLLLSSTPVSALAILQEARVPGVASMLAGVTDSQLFGTTANVSRATGPFAIWHDLGSYLFVIVILGVALLVNQSDRVMRSTHLIWIVVLAGVALVTTVTITPMVSAAVGVLVLAATARPRRRWVTRAVGLIAFLGIAFEPILAARYDQQYASRPPGRQIPFLPETLNFRIDVWTNEFLPVLAKHLVTGYGPHTPPRLAFDYTESVYVTILLRGGLPLLFLYAALMITLALRARDRRNDPDVARRAVAQVVFLLIVLVVFAQLVTNYFVNAGFPFLFWVLAALLMGDSATRVRRPPALSRVVPAHGPPRPVRPSARPLSSPADPGSFGGAGLGREPPADATASGAPTQPEHLRGVGTLLRGFAVLSSATVLMRLIGFVVVTLFARSAGPHTFGTFAFALALAGFVVGVPTNFGIGTLGIRRIARDPAGAGAVVGEAIAAQSIIAGVAAVSLVAVVSLVSTDHELVVLTPFVALYYVAYSMTVDWALQGLQRLRAVAVARLTGQALFGIVTPLVLVSGPAGAVRYAAVSALGAALTATVAFAMVRRLVGPIRISWAITPLWHLAKAAAPLGLAVIMIQIYYSMDQVLLGLLTNRAEVGRYAAAAKVPAVFIDFVVVWMSAVYPHASRLLVREPEKLRSQLGTFTSLGIVAAMPVSVGSAFVGTAVMRALFGPAYGSADPTFAILMTATAIAMVSISFTSLAMAAGHERTFAWSVTIASIVNVVLNVLLIPSYGRVGAAVATVAAELVILLICARRVIGIVGTPPLARRRIAGAAVATAGMSLALIAIPTSTSVWLRIAAGALVFLVGARACGAVRREDLALLRHGT